MKWVGYSYWKFLWCCCHFRGNCLGNHNVSLWNFSFDVCFIKNYLLGPRGCFVQSWVLNIFIMSWIFVVISDWRRKRLTSLEVIFVSCKSFTILLKKRKKFKVFYYFVWWTNIFRHYIKSVYYSISQYRKTVVVFNILDLFYKVGSELLVLSFLVCLELFKLLRYFCWIITVLCFQIFQTELCPILLAVTSFNWCMFVYCFATKISFVQVTHFLAVNDLFPVAKTILKTFLVLLKSSTY